MKLAMRFTLDGEELFYYVSEDLDDVSGFDLHAEGMKAFRKQHPDLASLPDGLVVGYETG